ncbi:MAG TPA: LytTR family DNA-binding domain-containing protein [Rubricoccaceae bacterium]|jgi:two-component system LytT family response regulator
MPDPSGPLRVLIADDERLGRKRLLDLLAAEPDVTVVGAAATGDEALALADQHAPDVAFLDIQMPGLLGLDVASRLAGVPAVVFVTAHAQHALRAFDLAATDYLLKPFDDARFRTALARARAAVQAHTAPARAGDVTPYLRHIAAEVRGVRRLVSVDAVSHVTQDGPYALVHTAGQTFVVREQMQAFEARLDPAMFVRAHRSAIVRLGAVEAFLTGPGGDYAVRLSGGATVRVARGRRDALVARLQAPTQ